jgi:hypothetical protein
VTILRRPAVIAVTTFVALAVLGASPPGQRTRTFRMTG